MSRRSQIIQDIQRVSLEGKCLQCDDKMVFLSSGRFEHEDPIKNEDEDRACINVGYCKPKYDMNKLRGLILKVARPKRYIISLLFLFNGRVASDETIQELLEDLRLTKKHLHEYTLFKSLDAKPNDNYISPYGIWY